MTIAIDCTTCGGARLSGTGHKVWCSGHILSPDRIRRPAPEKITERMSPFMRRLAEKNLPVKDLTGPKDAA